METLKTLKIEEFLHWTAPHPETPGNFLHWKAPNSCRFCTEELTILRTPGKDADSPKIFLRWNAPTHQNFWGFWVQTAEPRLLRIYQGESNMHQIVVTVSCRLCPLFPEGEFCRFLVPENALFLWEVILFLQNPLYESTVLPHREFGGKR